MPNKTKYSQKVVKQICTLIEERKHTTAEICSLVGISERVFYKWKKESAEFALSLARACARARKMETENIKAMSHRGLLILLQGGYFKQTETKTLFDDNGKVSNHETTIQLKYFQPNLSTVLYVINKLSGNNRKGLRLHIKNQLKEVCRVASKAKAQVLTVSEAASLNLEF